MPSCLFALIRRMQSRPLRRPAVKIKLLLLLSCNIYNKYILWKSYRISYDVLIIRHFKSDKIFTAFYHRIRYIFKSNAPIYLVKSGVYRTTYIYTPYFYKKITDRYILSVNIFFVTIYKNIFSIKK